MASQWGKYLAPITIATAWDFVFACSVHTTHTVQIPAGTYATPLHVARALRTALRALTGHSGATVTMSSTGYTTITVSTLQSITYGSCTAALKTFFGFAGTETMVQNGSVTSSLATTHGWFPGVITRGVALGEGLAEDTGWDADDIAAVAQSGAGAQHIIAPSRYPYRRTLVYGCLGKTEVRDGTRGVRPFRDRRRTSEWYWYPDRDDGTVESYGTQGDPGYNNWEADTDCDYYIVTVLTPPVATRLSRPDLFSVTMTLACKYK